MEITLAKRKVSIRLDEQLIDMLEKISRKTGTVYFDRDRTWLIEQAIKAQYEPIVNDETEEKEVSSSG